MDYEVKCSKRDGCLLKLFLTVKRKELRLPCMCSQGLGKDNTAEQELVLKPERGLGLEQELVRGGLQRLDNKDCNNAAQAGTDRANNRGLGT